MNLRVARFLSHMHSGAALFFSRVHQPRVIFIRLYSLDRHPAAHPHLSSVGRFARDSRTPGVRDLSPFFSFFLSLEKKLASQVQFVEFRYRRFDRERERRERIYTSWKCVFVKRETGYSLRLRKIIATPGE